MVALLRQIACLAALLPSGFMALAQPPADDPASPRRVDEVQARLPVERAATSSVVLARIQIALHRAYRNTSQSLCGGHWMPRGRLVFRQGPERLSNDGHPATNGGHWVYRALRHPPALDCKGVSRAEYFLEVSRHLPDWISIRPAGQLIAFRSGQPDTRDRIPLASRDYQAKR